MKKAITVTGLSFHFVYYILMILSIVTYEDGDASFGFWVYAVISALIIAGIYLAESIVAVTKRRSVGIITKLVLVALLYPVCIIFGGAVDIASWVIWNVYFAAVFIIQVVSLFRMSDTY